MTRAILDAAMSEAEWQSIVVAYAEAHHWTCWHDSDARRNDAGLPDLLCLRERCIWIELKRTGKRPTPVQRWFHDLLRTAGQEVHVWTPSDFDEMRIVLL